MALDPGMGPEARAKMARASMRWLARGGDDKVGPDEFVKRVTEITADLDEDAFDNAIQARARAPAAARRGVSA